MIWLNACPRCKHGAVYLDVDDMKHCVHCGFVQYRQLTPYLVEATADSSDRSNIRAHLPVDSPLSA